MSETTPVDDDYYELTGALANMLRVVGDGQSCLEGELNEAISVLAQYLDYDEYRACRAIEQLEAHTSRLPVNEDIPEVDQHVAAFWHARDQLRNHFVPLVELVAPDGWLDEACAAEWARFR